MPTLVSWTEKKSKQAGQRPRSNKYSSRRQIIMPDYGTSSPLLPQTREDDHGSSAPESQQHKAIRRFHRYRKTGRRLLESRRKHFLIMAVVVLDVVALLANVFIQLIACEMDQRDEDWVDTVSEALEITGLVCSSLFLLELLACLVSFGFRYDSSATLHSAN